jgi:hypothetical protein
MDITMLPHDELLAYAQACSTSHLGILSGPALRYALARIDGPVDILAIDWRKLHEWNDLLGYDAANTFVAQFAQTRQGRERRHFPRVKHARRPARLDVRGQWGGDELVFAVAAGDGLGLLMRLLRALDVLTAQLSAAQRQAIADRTGGLLDGFAIVAVLITNSQAPLTDARRAVDECGRLKAGRQTGERATSGAAGTVIGTLPATL